MIPFLPKRRRHNRQFYLADDLLMCSGTAKDGHQCHNWGRPNQGEKYWCHVHKVQALSALIVEESQE